MSEDAWIITPHLDRQYTDCVIFVKDDPDGRKAIEHAKDVLEYKWDACDNLLELNLTVTVKRSVACREDIDDGN